MVTEPIVQPTCSLGAPRVLWAHRVFLHIPCLPVVALGQGLRGVGVTMGIVPTAPWATWLPRSSLHAQARINGPDERRFSLTFWYRIGYRRRALVDQAKHGSPWAIHELLNRLVGKPSTVVQFDNDA